MRDDSRLTEFELYVMLALHRLGDDAYGVSIRQEIEQRTTKRTWMGSVYTALDRLTERGLVTSRLADPLPVRGGRARRYVRLTPGGQRALRTTLAALDRLRSPLGSDARTKDAK